MPKSIKVTRSLNATNQTVNTPRSAIPSRSNLLGVLIDARRAEHRSVKNLAEMVGVTSSAIRALENGKGPVSTLVAVMRTLPFHLNGLGPGRTFAEQLRYRRGKLQMSLEDVAMRAALPVNKVVELEEGKGSMPGLLRLLAVVAPRVSRRKPERAFWSQERKFDRDCRFTPPYVMDAIYAVFGNVSLDPCGHPLSPVVADRRFFLDAGDDGLREPWFGSLVFVNPPYSGFRDWMSRAHAQWACGNAKTIVCLVPVRTDSGFFHDTVLKEADIYLLRGRVPFLDTEGKSQVTPFSLMVVVFGATDRQKLEVTARIPGCWLSARDIRELSDSDFYTTPGAMISMSCSKSEPIYAASFGPLGRTHYGSQTVESEGRIEFVTGVFDWPT